MILATGIFAMLAGLIVFCGYDPFTDRESPEEGPNNNQWAAGIFIVGLITTLSQL